jgi:hypothetical protein
MPNRERSELMMATVKEWLDDSMTKRQLGSAYARKVQGPAGPPAPESAFDPRTQVSADAKYIVRNLVIWLLVVPGVLGLATWLLTR